MEAVDDFADERGEGVDEKCDERNEDDKQKDYPLPCPIGCGGIVNIGIFRFPLVVHNLLYNPLHMFLLSLKTKSKGNVRIG